MKVAEIGMQPETKTSVMSEICSEDTYILL